MHTWIGQLKGKLEIKKKGRYFVNFMAISVEVSFFLKKTTQE